jgi:hypothetical protein
MATSWHLTSLTVLGGTLHGKKLTIEDVVVEVLIGSDPDCHLHIDLPTVSPIHARLWIEPDDVTVYGTKSGPGVFVNFDRIDGDGKLRPGDLLWLGAPQAAGSVMLQVHFEERDTLPPLVVSPLAEEDGAGGPSAPPAEASGERPAKSASPATLDSGAPADPAPAALAQATPTVGSPSAETLTQDEALGVLPEDAPTPLAVALRADEQTGRAEAPIPAPPADDLSPAPPGPLASEAPEPAAEFEEFLVMDSGAAHPPPVPPTADEFIVSGFEADWPAPEAATGGSATLEAPTPEPEPPLAAPAFPVPGPPVTDDVFFVDVDAALPPAAVGSAGAESFFIDDGGLGSAGLTAPSPMTKGPEAPADTADASFAAAFLEEPLPKTPAFEAPPRPAPRPAAPAPPPVPRPTAPIPPAPAAKPVAAAASVDATTVKAPPAAAQRVPPAVSQRVAPKDLPVRPPSATSAVRPLPRPDVSQSVARGDRPSSPRPDRTQALRARRPPDRPYGRYLVLGAIVLAVVGGVGYAVSTLLRNVRLESIEPQRARVGDTVALVGRGFSTSPASNVVVFDDKPATVATATATRLEVVVPDVAGGGADARASVRVRVGRAESAPVEITVFAGPVLHGISPDVAMPGDEVVLAGSGWGIGPTVRFGGLSADVLEARETSIRVRVPGIDGGPGTSAPVVVSSGTVDSNPGPFYVGRIPLLTKAEPTSVSPGDVVTLTGRGFRRERVQNVVQVGGVRALVVAAFDSEIKVVVPWVPVGSRMLEVRVPSSAAPAQVPLVVGGPEGPGFHFVAEPFDAAPGRDHAVIAASFGPVFVLASSGGRSSAERALEAARRLNDAAASLADAREMTFDLRDADSTPSLGLVGRPEHVLEVTEEDAAAYGEDWTGLRGRGGPVSSGRLGRWWEAVAKDLVLVLVRHEKPHFAADLAPEGRALVDLFQAGGHGGGSGAAVVKASLREALRVVAFRVPPSVRGPATTAAVAARPEATPTTTASAAQPMPRLDGAWTGTETEGGRQRFVTVTFRGSTGTIAYEGVMTVSTPLLSVDQPQRGAARFSVELRGGLRYYVGRWDGRALLGKISADAGGAQLLGSFELRPR